jgi:hypothetical protein
MEIAGQQVFDEPDSDQDFNSSTSIENENEDEDEKDTKDQRYACEQCDFKTKQMKGLQIHVSKGHKFLCETSDEKFYKNFFLIDTSK